MIHLHAKRIGRAVGGMLLAMAAALPISARAADSATTSTTAPTSSPTSSPTSAPLTLAAPAPLRHWMLQDAAQVDGTGEIVSTPAFDTRGWHAAVVPGTVLTSLVADGTYPDPLHGLNNRAIPESLARTTWWYRTTLNVPAADAGRRLWLKFDGINYTAEVWLNGFPVGVLRGAFAPGLFDITALVHPGGPSTLAVLVSPQPHPGSPHQKSQATGTGPNGGMTAVDGPTFLSTIGWDWVPTIHDRDTGLWQDVSLATTGPVLIEHPYVRTTLPLPRTDSADLSIQATLRNASDVAQAGTLTGTVPGSDVKFSRHVQIGPAQETVVTVDAQAAPALHWEHPKLWWPNGYGRQDLYHLHLVFTADPQPRPAPVDTRDTRFDDLPPPPPRHLTTRPGATTRLATTRPREYEDRRPKPNAADDFVGGDSDSADIQFGVRTITYTVPGTPDLALCVNGVPVMAKGGDWGLDEALKRIDPARLDAQVRMHQQANYTIIRNWVGQSTSDAFYNACDKYGILLWDELFQPNPSDGPNPLDLSLYLENVKQKLLRYRNHPSIALWCARNEGDPPIEVGRGIQNLINELDPVRLYQPSSTRGRGVNSGGPYCWRAPAEYYSYREAFKTEIGSISIPTLEAVQAMLPRHSWDTIDDAWAEHDFCGGAQRGDIFPHELAARYGEFSSLADFIRKGQLATYEAYRAMFEARFAKLFKPETGVITWMSNPAQPSFVWQLYTHDLEPNAALFACREACEPVHIQMNQNDWHLVVVNNTPRVLPHLTVIARVYNLDGTLKQTITRPLDAAASAATDTGEIPFDPGLSSVHFVKLQLQNQKQQTVSENFYWRGLDEQNLQALDTIPDAAIEVNASRQTALVDACHLSVGLHNPTQHVAVMIHLQLRRAKSGQRVLPVFYSDNYFSLLPGEQKTITIDASSASLHGDEPQLAIDGWNIKLAQVQTRDEVPIVLNTPAVARSLPTAAGAAAEPEAALRINCGGPRTTPIQFGHPIAAPGIFERDIYAGYTGSPASSSNLINVNVPLAAPMAVYQSWRVGPALYQLPADPDRTYTLRLHFADTDFDAGGRRFNVDLNDQPVLQEFDIAAEAGRNTACVRTFTGVRPGDDGQVRIALRRGSAGDPILCGIELVPAN